MSRLDLRRQVELRETLEREAILNRFQEEQNKISAILMGIRLNGRKRINGKPVTAKPGYFVVAGKRYQNPVAAINALIQC